MDACGDVGPTVDHISAEHEVVRGRQYGNQAKQCFVTSMHVTDDPVMAPWGRHFQRFNHSILAVSTRAVSGFDYRKTSPSPDMDPRSLSPFRRVALLVRALDGAKKTNQALARCSDGEQMLDVLLGASQKLKLGLTREELRNTPPIRDWVWWKNKEALVTIGK